MRAAAPFMSGFVLYLLSFTSSFFAFKKAKELMGRKSFVSASLLMAAGLIAGIVFFTSHTKQPAYANITVMSEPPDGSNNPMGEGQGIFPGRVIWAWNPDATNAACANEPGNSFWDYKNNDTLIIRNMVEESIMELTGASSFQEAWDKMFRYQNLRKHGESKSYQPDEKIFIKINQGTVRWVLNNQEKDNGFAWPTSGGMNAIQPAWRRNHYAATETGPFVVLNILRHLVHYAGVPQENISIGDPMSHIFKHNFQVWHDEFPNVQYVDKTTERFNRTYILDALEPSVNYSDKGEVLKQKDERLFEAMEEADYMINVACLKSHAHGGITLCAKNHFGSITRGEAAHLHPSLISPGNLDQSNDGYKKYRVKVDIMRHKYLGANTMLFIVEGLFGGGANEVRPPRKWNMPPFNGHWSSSIFMSLDQVALESVCYDFLRTEFNGTNQPENYPNWYGVDDYLHQAADPASRPDNLQYDPDGEGAFGSLGVHEHWNNHIDKEYSINLGKSSGIELVQVSGMPVSTAEIHHEKPIMLTAYPNPFTDQLNISFETSEPAQVNIQMIDASGRILQIIENQFFPAGQHRVQWSAATENLKPGMYLVSVYVSSGSGYRHQSHKVQLIK